MFEEALTERARLAFLLAQREARAAEHHHLTTGHLVLGLLLEEDSTAAELLVAAGVEADEARAAAAETEAQQESNGNSEELPITPAALRAIEHALRTADQLQRERAQTEHILIGVCREAEPPVARLLLGAGVNEAHVHDELAKRRRRR